MKNNPENTDPCTVQASIENKTIKEDEKIAILNVTGTESYHVLFLKSYSKIAEIEKELNEADAKLNYSSKKILEEHL